MITAITSIRHLFRLLCCLCLLGLSASASADTLPPATTTPSLSEVLNPDGSLRAGASGSFDARQFRMQMGPDGRPLFRPASTTGAGDEYWQNGFGLAGTNGIVYTVLRAGSDIYIGGTFSTVGNIVARNVARWDGTRWSSLGTGANNGVKGGFVKAMAVIGTDVYLGADASFILSNGVSGAIVKWDGSTWSTVGTTSRPGVNGPVAALAVMGSDLYVGGSFSLADGVPVSGIAKWNGSAWSSLGSGVGFGSQPGTVYALGVMGSTLYVGGFFDKAGGSPANFVARWDGSAWSSLGTGTANGVGGGSASNIVKAIAVSGTDVYVAGGFARAGGVAANFVAKWSGTAWSGLGNGINSGYAPTSLAVAGSDLYVGGNFTEAGGVPAKGVARWNGSAWSAVGAGVSDALASVESGEVNALAVVGSELYVGGKFIYAGAQRADGLAKWAGSNWSNLGPASAQTNGIAGFVYREPSVYAVAVAGNEVYVGGSFTQVGGIKVNNIARWNGSTWATLGTGTNEGVAGIVQAIAINGTDVYVGGSFAGAGGVPASCIARWDGSAWHSLGSGVSLGMFSTAVQAIAIAGTDVYVGGRFANAGGVLASNVARWNGSSWSSLGTGISGSASGAPATVYALAWMGSTLYVGGAFTQAGGLGANNLAAWGSSGWNTVGNGVASTVGAASVQALAVTGSELYVGGKFDLAGSVPATSIARWNGSSWRSLSAPNANGVVGTVTALAVSGTDVYVGGIFDQAGSTYVNNLAKWDGSNWTALGTGTNGQVSGLAMSNAGLYAVGSFTAVGDESKVMNGIGLYNPASPTATVAARAVSELSLFPNPASARVTLQLAPVATERPVLVYDGQGRLVCQSTLPAGARTAVLPLSGLAPGTYLVRCEGASQRLVLP